MKTFKLSFLLAVATTLNSYCFGQWNQLDLSGTTWKLTDIYCTDKDTCYAVGVGGFILKTTDGGSNWIQLTSGTTNYLEGVHFMSSNVGIVVGEDIILKTTDAGANWVPKPKPIGFSGICVHFYGDSAGYAGASGGGQIIKTTDAGESWNWSVIIGPTGPVNSLFFTDKDTGYAVEVYLGTGRIWKTDNGGSNWTQIFSYPQGLTDVYFVNNTIGYIVGVAGVMFKTTDAGNNWDTLTSGTSKGLNSVYCVDADTCYVVGEDIILKTIDAGNTWNIQSITPPPAGLYSLYAVFFPSASIGYAAGRQANAYALKTGSGVGIDDIIANGMNLRIFPNPVGADKTINLMINSATPDNLSFTIYDLIGKEVLREKILSEYQSINIKEIQSGLYLFQLKNSNNVFAAGKIIVQ